MKCIHIAAAIALLTGSSSLLASWQVGAMAGTEYNRSTLTATPVLLPWLAYQSQHWSVDPTSMTYQDQTGMAQWRTGIALDHGMWQEDWRNVFAANAGVAVFLGPVRLDNSLKVALYNARYWSSRHTAGTMLPLGSVILAVETGAAFDQPVNTNEPDTIWVNGLQLIAAKDNWRFMAMSAWDHNLTTRQQTLSGMVGVLYEW